MGKHARRSGGCLAFDPGQDRLGHLAPETVLAAVVSPDQWLFGARISRADVVLAVLIARLVMVEEWALVQRDDLRQWWIRYQRRPAFAAAEIWTRFRRGRFLQALLMAPRTPILSPAPPAAPGQAPPGLQPPPD